MNESASSIGKVCTSNFKKFPQGEPRLQLVLESVFGDVKNQDDDDDDVSKSWNSSAGGGPDHAFGDLTAASGITDDMLDGLMALKDMDDVPGLPPLSTIEDMRYEKNTRKSTRADIERSKQEEIANARVRQGKFLINDNKFDVYFPMLDQRAALLRPLAETKTLGLPDVNCTLKGGGVSGQIGAIRLGMSRALQNWAPDQFSSVLL
ncbi:28S ribosomal protein S9, mitochondrial [Tanacetum coccineum]